MIAIEVVREIILPDSRTEALVGIILADNTIDAFSLLEKQKDDSRPYCLLLDKGFHFIPDSQVEFRGWLSKYGPTMWVHEYYLNRLYHCIHE